MVSACLCFGNSENCQNMPPNFCLVPILHECHKCLHSEEASKRRLFATVVTSEWLRSNNMYLNRVKSLDVAP
jgi:hypothetical protein